METKYQCADIFTKVKFPSIFHFISLRDIVMGRIKNNLKELEQSSRASSEFSPKPETEETSKTDGATVMDLSDRAETRDGVLERTAKDDSSTK